MTTDYQGQFGTTADGYQAARLQDFTYIAVPDGDGTRIASTWRSKKEIEQCTLADFNSREGNLDAGMLFRTFVDDMALHINQRIALRRVSGRENRRTPWGLSDSSTQYAEGLICYGTPSHGGFWLSGERQREMPKTLGRPSTWYEEDCEWCKVAIGLPKYFTDKEQAIAENTLRQWYPALWEAHFKRSLEPGESREKDEQSFFAAHAENMIAVSATRSKEHPDMTVVWATKGGCRNSDTATFLVPNTDYSSKGFGFVIQPHHKPYDGQ